jgi:hypothetical protein
MWIRTATCLAAAALTVLTIGPANADLTITTKTTTINSDHPLRAQGEPFIRRYSVSDHNIRTDFASHHGTEFSPVKITDEADHTDVVFLHIGRLYSRTNLRSERSALDASLGISRRWSVLDTGQTRLVLGQLCHHLIAVETITLTSGKEHSRGTLKVDILVAPDIVGSDASTFVLGARSKSRFSAEKFHKFG